MKKLIAIVLCLAVVFSLSACGKKTPTKQAKKDIADKSVLKVCLASEPQTLDPALNSAVDGATLCAHLFSGLAKWAEKDGKLVIVPDLATELPEGVANSDGTVTYTYTLRDGLKWSDGKDLTAADFVFAWNRAASPALAADYGYMFEFVDGYAEMWETEADGETLKNPDAKLNVEAVDAKTLKVTINNALSFWNEILAFPCYYPVREDVVSNDAWATDPSTYVCNGPYTMSEWKHDSLIVLKKNENYVDAASVTMPTLEFYLSDDTNNMLTNYQSGEWLMIDDVPINEIKTLKESYKDEFFVAGQIGTYYVCWNINENILPADSTLTGAEAEKAKAEIRNALSLVIDRNYVVDYIAQGGQVPASSFVAMGMTDTEGEFYKNAGTSEDYDGYYNVAADAFNANFNTAVETLKKYYKYDESSKKFTNVPTFTYLYNTGDAHKAIGEYLQTAFANVGITMNLENQEWATFLETRKQGNYSVARNGWLADYNDPICFLDMWTTASGNNDVQFGKGAHKDLAMYNLDLTAYGYDIKVTNGTWAQTFDVLISTIKSCTDSANRYAMMHIAEDMLMESGCITPLYFYTDLYMIDSRVEGFFSNPLGYKYFMYCTIK